MARKTRRRKKAQPWWRKRRIKWSLWRIIMAIVIVLTLVVFFYRRCQPATEKGTFEQDSAWPYKDLTSGPFSKDYDGIDISRHQGRIHWDVLRHNSDIQFIYIKATEGKKTKDPMYKKNVEKAHEAGFLVGAYHFLHKRSTGTEQFDNFRRTTEDSHLDLLPVVDVEDDGMRGKSRNEIQAILRDFLVAAKAYYGKSPIIYCSEKFYNYYLSPEFDSYYLFIASYSHKPVLEGKPRYDIWQFSERGRVRGIWNWVDLNCFAPGRSVEDIKL